MQMAAWQLVPASRSKVIISNAPRMSSTARSRLLVRAFTLKDQLVIFLMLLGGEPLEGKRHIFWNFVSSRKDRIEQAAADWRARRFPGVPGDSEFIPLPEVLRAA